jgi:hypothetical protein
LHSVAACIQNHTSSNTYDGLCDELLPSFVDLTPSQYPSYSNLCALSAGEIVTTAATLTFVPNSDTSSLPYSTWKGSIDWCMPTACNTYPDRIGGFNGVMSADAALVALPPYLEGYMNAISADSCGEFSAALPVDCADPAVTSTPGTHSQDILSFSRKFGADAYFSIAPIEPGEFEPLMSYVRPGEAD